MCNALFVCGKSQIRRLLNHTNVIVQDPIQHNSFQVAQAEHAPPTKNMRAQTLHAALMQRAPLHRLPPLEQPISSLQEPQTGTLDVHLAQVYCPQAHFFEAAAAGSNWESQLQQWCNCV
jgi:hypothetical protein